MRGYLVSACLLVAVAGCSASVDEGEEATHRPPDGSAGQTGAAGFGGIGGASGAGGTDTSGSGGIGGVSGSGGHGGLGGAGTAGEGGPGGSGGHDISACGQTPPWKEGFGAKTTGGVGGKVLYVTNTKDSGPGSLRAAIETAGARTILFRVGGTIELHAPLVIEHGDVTIAGQSAPLDSGGVTLRGDGSFGSACVVVRASNVIMRHLRIRRGPGMKDESNGDAITIGDPNAALRNLMFDHLSISWGTDELINTWFDTADLTIQWTIAAEGLNKSTHIKGAHSKGVMIGGGRISLLHTLMAHNQERNPLITSTPERPVEVINNVIYGYGWAVMPTDSYGHKPQVNLIGNLFRANENTKSIRYEVEPRTGDNPSGYRRFYLKGNLGPNRANDKLDERLVVSEAFWDLVVEKPFPGSDVPSVTSANRAYEEVLAGAGARVPRLDAVDERILRQVKDRTGTIIDDPSQVGGWPKLATGTPIVDSDDDGIPDAYESSCATLEAYLDWRGHVR